MRDLAIVEQLSGGRPIRRLSHRRERTSGQIAVLERGDAVVALCAHAAALTALPAELDQLDQLERLDVGDNQLAELPALPASLRELYIHDNRIAALPALPALDVLDANRNRLDRAPALRDLGFVYLAGNRLRDAPVTSGVRYLNVSDNPLGALAVADPAIEELRAEHAELETLEIDPVTGPAAGLRELSLRGNRLAAVPAAISALPRLEALDLRGNQLDELPEALAALPLTRLDLRWNPLRRRPPWLDELARRGCRVYE
jgi:Leucine-rich repeat (LRR) protein